MDTSENSQLTTMNKLNKKLKIIVPLVVVGAIVILVVRKIWIGNNQNPQKELSEIQKEFREAKERPALELKEQQNEPQTPNCQSIRETEIISLLRKHEASQATDYIIIDVRGALVDYSGGHIVRSINISDATFPERISDLLTNHNGKSRIILVCMYGAHRSVKCSKMYTEAVAEVIANYSKETGTSFYFGKSETKKQEKIEIKCDDEMIGNLTLQNVFVLVSGFFTFVNYVLSDEYDEPIESVLQDFDINYWQQLALNGVEKGKKRWYHNREYFSDNCPEKI